MRLARIKSFDIMWRIPLIALGLAAITWASGVLFAWAEPTAIVRAADRIVRGEAYKNDDLDKLQSTIEGVKGADGGRAVTLRGAAIIELRQAEMAIAEGRRLAIDDRLTALQSSLTRALTMAPTDAFLWLVLFWRDNTVKGFDPARLRLLELSYRLSPNEGWVGVRRSPLALALYPRLRPSLQEAAAIEFAGLVQSRFAEMPDILMGPGWAAREALLPRLAAVSEPQRKTFARALYRAGFDVEVPGIARPDDRPWSR